jgi:hypothetical protein
VPAIHSGIFWLLAELEDFAKQRAGRRISFLEFAADPGEAVPSTDGAVVWLAEWIFSAG